MVGIAWWKNTVTTITTLKINKLAPIFRGFLLHFKKF
jgi:hypothetical protein